MNTPTKITIARIALIPFMLVFFAVAELLENNLYYIGVASIFIIASVTDFVDGYLARRNNQVTDLGKFLDPIADKVLVASGLLILIGGQVLFPTVYAVIASAIILAREFLIGALRQMAASKNVVLAADNLGKIKTISTLVSMSFLFVAQCVNHEDLGYKILYWTGFGLFAIAVLFTIASGVNYLVKNKHVLKQVDKGKDNE